ncbi:ATP synthase complex assembly protein atp12 [Steccherinum ochraceum]|uniref:ATP synthase complex assembly protein atp12 n=1 Tax=Steccherinum ochraceum TaxID=92696 RepID=A0A4R0RC65_9APHY|nr:ATP synthase complex assembly protein atp12 [Steccherinum ochraceum]
MASILRQLGQSSRRRILSSPRHHVARSWTPVRCQATVASGVADAPAVTATNRAEATLKRFWKTVSIEPRDEALAVTLDKRPLKTPSGNQLVFPKSRVVAATLVASEWENQETLLKQHSLPLTSLASRAIDSFGDETTRAEVRAQLLKYLETDTVCFHSDDPPGVVKLQQEHWDPILKWARETFEVEINTTDALFLVPHSPATIRKFDEVLATFDPWQMAAMERAVYASKSFLIGLALVMRHITVEQASQAAHVEVNSQIERWGEVEDTHDVDFQNIRQQLGSAACLLVTV